jgi:regulatory protein
MTIVSIKTETGGESKRVELSDNTFFSFMPCYVPPVFGDTGPDTANEPYIPELYNGKELNADEAAGLRFASECMAAEKAALKLIARAEQTPMGLLVKLEKRGHSGACIHQVLTRLKELNLLDEQRYIKLWLESRLARRADSPRHLLSCLCARGIDRNYAESGIKAILDTETELSLLKRYVKKLPKQKKFIQFINRSNADPQRSLISYLKGQGFSFAVIEMYSEDEQAAISDY